jgi:tetratricopeptide (TPR) repeat protein
LISEAGTAAKGGNNILAEQLLRKAVEKEPKHKTVRRNLASVLFEQEKLDEAVRVVAEQTKINPFDDYCYNLLGKIYWKQQKYTESETAFRKQLEIAPLDKTTKGNLGQMLVQARKYREAIPELEQAISLDPEQEAYHLALGTALLNLDQTQKAIVAFDRAVKLAPGPFVWNDIAYNLALHSTELGRAKQYAESAVTQTSTELLNLELAEIAADDMDSISSIAAYWDTLGWVFYKTGDIDQAEKYCTAAWVLMPTGEGGFHLGQIFEKKGRTADALKVYTQAASAKEQVPELKESLVRLAGSANIDASIAKAKAELIELRTVKLSNLLKGEKEKTEADFFVVLTPGAMRESGAVEVKFIRGDKKLQPFSEALKRAKYLLTFPNDIKTRVIRRGTLTCQPNGGECSFVMMSPEDVTSVD